MKLWSEEDLQFLQDNAQLTYTEIAKLLDRTPMGVRFQFRKHKIKKIKSPSKKYIVNETFFDRWTDKMSYILGFTFADGSIRKRQGKSSTFRVYNSDLNLLKEIRKTMKSNHKIT